MRTTIELHPDAGMVVKTMPYRTIPADRTKPAAGVLTFRLAADCGSTVNFHGLTPEQIMDLGRRIETAGAELANRMAFDANHPGYPIDHPDDCACESCLLVAAEAKRFEGIPY